MDEKKDKKAAPAAKKPAPPQKSGKPLTMAEKRKLVEKRNAEKKKAAARKAAEDKKKKEAELRKTAAKNGAARKKAEEKKEAEKKAAKKKVAEEKNAKVKALAEEAKTSPPAKAAPEKPAGKAAGTAKKPEPVKDDGKGGPLPGYQTIYTESGGYETTVNKMYALRKPWEPENPRHILAFMPGMVEEIRVKKGQKVEEGDSLLIFRAMKMNNDILSPVNGSVKSINAKEGENVSKNFIIIELE